MIFKYSAIKIKTNFSEPYSTLKPLTNSLSPSTKSKGVRLVSANIDKNQKKNKPPLQKTPIPPSSKPIILILNPKKKRQISKRINPATISYLIVCAIERTPPRKEYFEFEDHPASKVL